MEEMNTETNEMNEMEAMNVQSANEELSSASIANDKEAASTSLENETKNEKFMRLAEFRVNKIMTAVASLDKLHNKGSYDYTEEQVNMMFESLEAQLAEVKGHFGNTKVQEAKFSFGQRA